MSREDDEILRLQADLCKMLAHPLRLKILEELCEGEKNVSQLLSKVDARQPTVSQHLRELKKAELVKTRKDGAKVFYRLAHPEIMDACQIIRDVLIKRYDEDKKILEGGR